MAFVFKVLQGELLYDGKRYLQGERFRGNANDLRDLRAAGIIDFVKNTSGPEPVHWRRVWKCDNLLTMPLPRLRALHKDRDFTVRVNRYFPELSLAQLKVMKKNDIIKYIIAKRGENGLQHDSGSDQKDS